MRVKYVFRDIVSNLLRCRPATQALLECSQVEANPKRVCLQIHHAKGLGIGEELVVHLPVLPLSTRTVGCFGRLEGLFMNGGEGKVAEDVFDLPGCDVIALNLGQGLPDVPRAIGTLIIGKLDEGQIRLPRYRLESPALSPRYSGIA